jgi:RNA polymerase sigma factor (sigma-70 family)
MGGRVGEDDAAEQFSAFCRQVHPQLVGTLTLYCGDRDTGHDLAQETLARIWSNWERLRGSTGLRAYAYRTGLNLAKNRFRRLAVRRRYRHLVAVDADEGVFDGDHAQAVAVRDAVAALPLRKRTALVLRYYADLSVADTAQAMGIPSSTVKTLTRRALDDLRSNLVLDLEEEADVH